MFSFDEFLMDMKQSKRKNIRQERKKVCRSSVLFPSKIAWLVNRSRRFPKKAL